MRSPSEMTAAYGGIGLTAGIGFTGFSMSGNVSASFLNGDMHAEGVTNTNALVSGGTVTLKSGRDATVIQLFVQ